MGIKRIGVELEGGWTTRPAGWIYDGSVSGEAPYVWGEVPSPPMARSEITTWLAEYWPQAVNPTCGLHVHVSFDTVAEYATLMNRAADLEARILRALGTWADLMSLPPSHPLRSRMAGDNSYCAPGCRPDDQALARTKTSARYRMLNFCWSQHKTLEVRLLGGIRKVAIAHMAITLVLDAIEAELAIGAAALPTPKVEQDGVALMVTWTADGPAVRIVATPEQRARLHGAVTREMRRSQRASRNEALKILRWVTGSFSKKTLPPATASRMETIIGECATWVAQFTA